MGPVRAVIRFLIVVVDFPSAGGYLRLHGSNAQRCITTE